MKRTLLASILIALTAAPASSAAGQIPTNPDDLAGIQFLMGGRKPKTGTARLRGRVVAADSGAVVRRAQVRISGPDIGTKTAFTDGQGRYEFKDLPAGRFNVSVTKSGFITMQYGQSRPFEPGRPIDLVDAQVMEKADVVLQRGAAVAGRILDEFGEPVSDASVTAMRAQYTAGRRRLVPAGRQSTTNDLGQFRVFGLAPGEYYLSATVRTMESFIMDMMGGSAPGGPSGSNSTSGYAATYYPGTPNAAEAQRVSLSLGQELPSVDIQLQTVKLARISGIATTSDGKPMSGAMVMLLPTMKEALEMMPGGTSRTDKDGNFTLSNVAPGEYSLQAQSIAALMSSATQAMSIFGGGETPAAQTPAPQQMEREFATATITVAGEDITNVVLSGTRGAKAAGRIVFAGGERPEGAASMRLMATPTDINNMPASSSAFGLATIKEGTFEIDGLVGGRSFNLMNLPKGWYLKRVTHDNDDITDKGFDFKPGADVEGFEIELTNRAQSLTGSVKNDKGEAVKEYTVVVFPDDPEKWTLAAASRWLHIARPDQQAHYKIPNLPAGSYLAIALEYVPQGEWQDPEWLKRAVRNATKVTIAEGAAATLDLKLSGS